MIGSDKLRQLWYDMRHQSVVTSVTLVGTALSVCLLMVVITIQQLNVMPFPPESNRNRILYGQGIHIMPIKKGADFANKLGGGSMPMSGKIADDLYGGLKGVAAESQFESKLVSVVLKGINNKMAEAKAKYADDQFWKIFDHRLLFGRYYDQAENESDTKVAVITESVSRRLFGKSDGVGKTLSVNFIPYTVVGIVADPTPQAPQSYGEIFMPLGRRKGFSFDGILGNLEVALLLKEGVDISYIRKQVIARYANLATELAQFDIEPIYHEGPYTTEIVMKGEYGPNTTPDLEGGRRMRYITYLVLLLLPAINLAGMLQSRMRRRTSELGIRRAFGCTRLRIIRDILSENFIITLIGGLIGWSCSIAFLSVFRGLFSTSMNSSDSTAELTLLLNWRFIVIILLVCFILNIITASIPAWQASRLNATDAINNRQKL